MNQPKDSRGKKILLWTITIVILVPGAFGFGEKLFEFFRTLTAKNGGAEFTLVPLSNYLLVAAGMACFFVWAIAQGMFRDIEKPKFDMLESEARLDELQGHREAH